MAVVNLPTPGVPFMGGDMPPGQQSSSNTATTEDSTSMKGIKTSGTLEHL